MRINGTCITEIVIAPDQGKDLFTVHDLTDMGSEKMKDLNFLRCAGNEFALDLDLIVIQVDLKSFETEERSILLRFVDTTEDRLDTCDYFSRREGLNNIVIRTELKSEYSVDLLVSIAQGIVDSNRRPHPIFFEVKKQCEGIKIFSSADNPSNLNVHNVNPFGSTPSIELKWQLLLGGVRLTGGSGIVPPIPPMGNRTMQFPFEVGDFLTSAWAEQYPKAVEVYNQAVCKELLLDIRLTLENDSYYARAGFELAFYQQILVDEVYDPSSVNENEVSCQLF